MLILTNLIAVTVGFFIFHSLMSVKNMPSRLWMRVCVANAMVVSFLFSMFIVAATGSHVLSIILGLFSVLWPGIWMLRTHGMIEVVEYLVSAITGIAMGVMLMTMVDATTVLLIQLALLVMELLLLGIVKQSIRNLLSEIIKAKS